MNRLKFQKSLQSLTAWRERAFILSLAERAAPNVALYLSSLEVPITFPKSLIDSIWLSLIMEPEEERIVEALDQVIAFLPDDENTEHYGVLPTVDCLHLFEQALLAGLNDEKKRALDASQHSIDTIIQFIEFSEGEGLSENKLVKLFDSHALVQREFSFQSELSDLLRSASHPGEELILALRELAQDDGVSNIGISLN
jgi:uncharacterized protein YjaG (DUF416 family)